MMDTIPASHARIEDYSTLFYVTVVVSRLYVRQNCIPYKARGTCCLEEAKTMDNKGVAQSVYHDDTINCSSNDSDLHSKVNTTIQRRRTGRTRYRRHLSARSGMSFATATMLLVASVYTTGAKADTDGPIEVSNRELSPQEHYELAETYRRQPDRDFKKSLQHYWKAAHLVPTEAQDSNHCFIHSSEITDPFSCAAVTALADIYLVGWKGVVAADVRCAVRLYNESSLCGNETGQYVVGVLSSHGLFGFPKSEATAILHYHFAALGGNHAAQGALGYRHQMGIYVPTKCSSAALYLSAANQNEVKQALPQEYTVPPKKQRLSEDSFDSIGSSETDETQLTQYFLNSAGLGHSRAQIALGHFYYYGIRSLPRNFRMAAKYLHEALVPVVQAIESQDSEAATSKELSVLEDIVPGSSTAMAILGQLYFEGLGVDRNVEAGIDFLSEVANRGHPMALMSLAKAYLFGIGVSQDVSHAMTLLSKAASMGYADAHYNLGIMYLTAGRSRRLQDLAKQYLTSEEQADRALAEIQERITRNFRMAQKHLSTCANNGHVNCAYAFAQMHLHGIGLETSCSAALQYLTKALQNGKHSLSLQAAYLLLVEAEAHESTLTTLKSFIQESFTTPFMSMKSAVESTWDNFALSPTTGPKAQSLDDTDSGRSTSFKFGDRKLLDTGTTQITDASPLWGHYDIEPAGSPTSLKLASLLKYLLAAEEGFELAQWNAAILLDKFQDEVEEAMRELFGSSTNVRQTTENLLERAASQNNVDAYLKRGDYRYYGSAANDIAPDSAEAAAYYRTAADMGNPQAMYNIGMMYEEGDGLPADLHLAKRFYDMSLGKSGDSLFPVKIAKARLWLRAIWWAVYERNEDLLSRESFLQEIRPSEVIQLIQSTIEILLDAFHSELENFIAPEHPTKSAKGEDQQPEDDKSTQQQDTMAPDSEYQNEEGKTSADRPLAHAQKKYSRRQAEATPPFSTRVYTAYQDVLAWLDARTVAFLLLIGLVYFRDAIRHWRNQAAMAAANEEPPAHQ
eukprot:gb/GECG01009597.1/.p1 GENE.gb/GECG01009597.1/~~gb/GECG01009597.1/.p1  ORF type:complete len:1023 (+),score=120.37 gb/GECG01009597.1/:1-3069(+)